MATKKFILAEKDIPQAWYNVIADMPNKPMSPLNPATKSPLAVEDLYPIFAESNERLFNFIACAICSTFIVE